MLSLHFPMKEEIGVNTRDKRADHCQHKENNKACGISDQTGYGRDDECEQSAGDKQFATEAMGTSPVVLIRERPWKLDADGVVLSELWQIVSNKDK